MEMTKKKFAFKKQKGFTLVEAAIVVAVGALLLIGVSAAPRIMASNKANQEISELPKIVVGIQKVWNNQPTYAGATALQAVQLNAFPPERVVNPVGPVIGNRWGGNITMATAVLNGIADAGVALTYTNVPDLECTDVIPAVEGRFANITVNGVSVKPAGVFNVGLVGANCNQGPANTIVYTFGK